MTGFTSPVKIIGKDGITGNVQTESSGYVKCTKVVSLGVGALRKVITLPPFSTPLSLRAFTTSAPNGTDVSAFSVSWGNSADATRYGTVAVSAVGQVRTATVSAADDFGAGATMVIVVSAISTTTFTAGGIRAFVEYVITE